MQDVNYIFLKNNYFLFSLFIILVTGASCTPDTLWNIPVNTVKENLKASQYSFLKEINYKEKNVADVRVLGPGASYYLSFIFSYIGFPEYAKELLTLSWQHEKKYWKDEAGFLLLQGLLEEKEYKLLEAYSLQYLKKIKKSKNLQAVKKLYIASLYWQKKDEAVLHSIKNFFPDTKNIHSENPEIMLFQVVSECRLKRKGWQKNFTDFFIKSESTGLHQRAYQFIMLEKERFTAFDEGMQQFLLAKSFLGSGNPDFALPLVEYFLNYIDPDIIAESTIIKELGLAYLSLGKYEQGLKFLDILSKKCISQARLDAHEMAGRIARKQKRYKKAAQYLKIVMNDAHDPEQKDRAAWFYLACVLEMSPVLFIDEIIQYAKEWVDPEYFDDIIQKSIGILIAEKKWEALHYFFDSMKPLASNTIETQMNYLFARFRTLGYIKDKKNHSEFLPEKYFQQISNKRDKNYYTFLASSLLHKEPLFLKTSIAATGTENKINRNTLSSIEEFVIGFFDFGLIEDGYSMLIKNIKLLSNEVIFYAVTILNERGFYKKSIWLMNSIQSRKNYQLTDKEILYSYPPAYKSIIDLNAKKRGFDASFFYALVREESAFDAGNTSPVGAVGLTQLMPPTANDIAGWLRLDKYDLTNPETNVLMGAYYYSRLLKLLESIPKTLIAYNAGLGRLRSWEKEYKGLPMDLFIEALPYRETRGYLKKIIVSACIYSYLYEKKPPYEVFSQLFPDMF